MTLEITTETPLTPDISASREQTANQVVDLLQGTTSYIITDVGYILPHPFDDKDKLKVHDSMKRDGYLLHRKYSSEHNKQNTVWEGQAVKAGKRQNGTRHMTDPNSLPSGVERTDHGMGYCDPVQTQADIDLTTSLANEYTHPDFILNYLLDPQNVRVKNGALGLEYVDPKTHHTTRVALQLIQDVDPTKPIQVKWDIYSDRRDPASPSMWITQSRSSSILYISPDKYEAVRKRYEQQMTASIPPEAITDTSRQDLEAMSGAPQGPDHLQSSGDGRYMIKGDETILVNGEPGSTDRKYRPPFSLTTQDSIYLVVIDPAGNPLYIDATHGSEKVYADLAAAGYDTDDQRQLLHDHILRTRHALGEAQPMNSAELDELKAQNAELIATQSRLTSELDDARAVISKLETQVAAQSQVPVLVQDGPRGPQVDAVAQALEQVVQAPPQHAEQEQVRETVTWGPTLGRDYAGLLPQPDGLMSRTHFALGRNGKEWWIKDAGSKNGTLVNGTKASKPVKLVNGDRLQVGTTTFTFFDGSLIAGQHVFKIADKIPVPDVDRQIAVDELQFAHDIDPIVRDQTRYTTFDNLTGVVWAQVGARANARTTVSQYPIAFEFGTNRDRTPLIRAKRDIELTLVRGDREVGIRNEDLTVLQEDDTIKVEGGGEFKIYRGILCSRNPNGGYGNEINFSQWIAQSRQR